MQVFRGLRCFGCAPLLVLSVPPHGLQCGEGEEVECLRELVDVLLCPGGGHLHQLSNEIGRVLAVMPLLLLGRNVIGLAFVRPAPSCGSCGW